MLLTFEERAYCPSFDAAEGGVLTEGRLKEEQRYSSKRRADEVRNEERPCCQKTHQQKQKKQINLVVAKGNRSC